MGMIKKYRISSYAIIIGIAIFILSPVVGCTQNEGNALTRKDQNDKKLGQQNNQIKKTTNLESKLSSPAKFSRREAGLTAAIKGLQNVAKKKDMQISAIKKEMLKKDKQINILNQNIKSLQTIQTEFAKIKNAQVEKDKKINGLNVAIKSLQNIVKKKETEEVQKNKQISNLNIVMTSLQTAVKKKETELNKLDTALISRDTKLVTMKAAINCYRKALSTWDDLHRREGITEQNLLTIAVELRREVGNCPGI